MRSSSFICLGRSKANERNIILDEATRNRRQKKALEALEKDNFQDDVSSSTIYVSDYRLQLNKKFQQRFQVTNDSTTPDDINTSKLRKNESKLRFRKNFATLLEEEV